MYSLELKLAGQPCSKALPLLRPDNQAAVQSSYKDVHNPRETPCQSTSRVQNRFLDVEDQCIMDRFGDVLFLLNSDTY
jgi:hypothetical protein